MYHLQNSMQNNTISMLDGGKQSKYHHVLISVQKQRTYIAVVITRASHTLTELSPKLNRVWNSP